MNLNENINRIKEVMGLIKEYEEQQPDIKSSAKNNFIFIDSISEVPHVGKEMNKKEFKHDGISSLSWDNIVIVRASNESPVIKNGRMIIHTSRALKTIGYTEDFMKNLKQRWEDNYSDEPWEEFEKKYKKAVGDRWTKHFTLNHMVGDNMGGSWKDLSFVYLLPGKEMVTLNGAPSSLYAIDTWYSKSVVIPKYSVVLYSPNSRDKIEKMSLKFNSELGGETLKYPVYFLQINSKSEVDQVIQAMGYSVIEGGQHYSPEKNIDSEFRDFSNKEGIPSLALHANTFYADLEQNNSYPGTIIQNLNWIKDEIKNENKVNQWYESQRRVINSALDNFLSNQKNKVDNKGDFEELFRGLSVLKENMDNFPMIKRFKSDILNSITRNKVIDTLKKYYWKENGYSSFEEFLDNVLPK